MALKLAIKLLENSVTFETHNMLMGEGRFYDQTTMAIPLEQFITTYLTSF